MKYRYPTVYTESRGQYIREEGEEIEKRKMPQLVRDAKVA